MTERLRVLFVCTANICRSPFMELLAGSLAGGRLIPSSAGTHGFTDHAMDDAMATTLTERGVPFEAFRSRRLTGALVDEADLVLTAEATHRQFVLEEHPTAFRTVFTLGQFAEAVRRNPGLFGRKLVAAAGTRRPPSIPDHDVADPYGCGPEAAAAGAAMMEDLLRLIVPALTSPGRGSIAGNQ